MRLSRARSSGPAASPHTPSSVDRIPTTSASEFSVHTVMKSRRLMGPPPAGEPHPTTSLSEGRVVRHSKFDPLMTGLGLVSRVSPVQTAMRNCTRDEGRSFEVGNQVLISSHRKLLSSKAMVVSVAEKSGQEPGRQG